MTQEDETIPVVIESPVVDSVPLLVEDCDLRPDDDAVIRWKKLKTGQNAGRRHFVFHALTRQFQ